MNIDQKIEKWQNKHQEVLDAYSKGSANNEVMQMYRSRMKDILEIIHDLEEIKNIANTVLNG